ncbi:MAG: hypothetical protein Q7T93_16480 [Methylobacterium sp.]|nr:hypothetical protein [Methylobacterium sp.]MDO9428414.1 hypothetical protein [Methylobacterium sp.]
MDEARLRALEARITALEGALESTRNEIQWATALIFIVPIGLMIVLRVWS